MHFTRLTLLGTSKKKVRNCIFYMPDIDCVTTPDSNSQQIETRSLDYEYALLKLLEVREEPGEFNIEYNEMWCCDGTDLPPDSF